MSVKLYLTMFVLTVMIEIAVALLFGYRNKKAVLSIFIINVLTHPSLNYFLWVNGSLGIIQMNMSILWLLEIIVAVVEGILLVFLLRQKFVRMILLASVMNLASFCLGLMLFRLSILTLN